MKKMAKHILQPTLWEGEVWECALAKEIVIDKKVKASLPEIAACCLWHSSFYGFTPETEEECFRDMFGYDYCKELEYNRALIQKFGGVVPSLINYHQR